MHRIRGPEEDESKEILNPSKDNLEEFLAFQSDDIVEMISKCVDLEEDQQSAGKIKRRIF